MITHSKNFFQYCKFLNKKLENEMKFSHNIIGIQPGSFFFDIKIDILWQENSSSFDYKINQNTSKNKDNCISKGGKLLFYAFN